MGNLTVLNVGKRAAADLSANLRALADAVDRGEISDMVLGCIRSGEFELMFSASTIDSIVLADLLQRRAVDKLII